QDLISNLVPELVIDPLEVVDIDQIEDKIAIAKFDGWIVKRTQRLAHIGLNGIGKVAPVANAGEHVGEGSVQQLKIGIGQFLFEAGLFHDANQSEHHNRGQRQENAELRHGNWQTAVEERPCHQQRKDEGKGSSRS